MVQWFRPARRVQPGARLSPEQLRKALTDMLADPETGRLIPSSLVGRVLPIQGGQVTCDIEANRIKSGTFGASGCQGNYSFLNGNLGIGTMSPAQPLQVNRTDGDLGGVTMRLSSSVGTGDAGMKFEVEGFRTNLWQLFLSRTSGALKIGRDGIADYVVIKDAGNVGIGTGVPAEKLDVAGNIKCNGLNKIIFLRPSGGNDSTQINNAIASLAATNGGIIMLEPGEYRINSPIMVSSHGVKLRGYGGGWPDGPGNLDVPVTKLRWVGDPDGTVVSLKSPFLPPEKPIGEQNPIQDLELSDLTIDGNNQAGIGLELNAVMSSKFISTHIRKMKNPGGIGLKVHTTATQSDINSGWNLFLNCSVIDAPKCVVLDGSPVMQGTGPANASQNIFVNLSVRYFTTATEANRFNFAGIWMGDCDSNVFVRTSIFTAPEDPNNPGGRFGHGVYIDSPRKARGNHFYWVAIPNGLFINNAADGVFEAKNFVSGYMLNAGVAPPLVPPSTNDPTIPAKQLMSWIDSEGRLNGFTWVP